MVDNALAAQIQPQASIGPAVGALLQMRATQDATDRANALAAALAGGDPSTVARLDPKKADDLLTYQQNARTYEAWRRLGPAVARGDADATNEMTAIDPNFGLTISKMRGENAKTLQTMSQTQIDAWSKIGPALAGGLFALSAETNPANRTAMEAPLLSMAKMLDIPPDQAIAVLRNSTPDQLAALGRGFAAFGADAQKLTQQSAFGPTEKKPNTFYPAPMIAGMGPGAATAFGADTGAPSAPAAPSGASPSLVPPNAGPGSATAMGALPASSSGGAAPPPSPSSSPSPLPGSGVMTGAAPPFTPPEAASAESSMRNQFEQLSKPFIVVRDYYRTLKDATPNQAGDISIVFGYMKMLDPTSVVMPSEQATATNAPNVPNQIRQLWNYVLGNGQLTPEQRTQLRNEAERVYRDRAATQENLTQQYRDLATRTRLNPENVVLNFTNLPEVNEGRTATNPETGERVIFKGGQWVPYNG